MLKTSLASLNPFAKFSSGAYRTMSKDEIKEDMDRRYETGRAYPDTRLWIEVHHKELERIFLAFLTGKTEGAEIIEVGAGLGGIAAHRIRDAKRIVATDLSDTALNTAREFFKGRRELSFVQMDSEALTFPDQSFDIAISKEVIEHLPNPTHNLKCMHRVLRQNGILVLSTPNADSFHLRMNRKLGHPDFMCSGDHIREYSYTEMINMLGDAGFEVEDAKGVSLMPYHYIKDVFVDSVQKLTEYDPEVVEWQRILGERAGPEFAFNYVILARKV